MGRAQIRVTLACLEGVLRAGAGDEWQDLKVTDVFRSTEDRMTDTFTVLVESEAAPAAPEGCILPRVGIV